MNKRILVFTMAAILPILVFSKNLPDTLLINNTQQLLLNFSTSIQYVDLGSEDIVGKTWFQKTCLSLNTNNKDMETTTISVVTSEGKYYSYVLKFSEDLKVLAYNINDGEMAFKVAEVSISKTTHFIASEDVVDIIVGNDSIIADNALGIKNIVKIKSLSKNIERSSFTIITKSGNIYPFKLLYNETPSNLSIYIGDSKEMAIFSETPQDKNKLEKLSKNVIDLSPSYNHLGDLNHKMILSLDGIYSVDDWLFFRLHLENLNNIDYGIDFIKTYIRDKKSDKYLALQEQEIYPFYIHFSNEKYKDMLPAGEQVEIVLFFHRFTIPKSRIMCFEFFEKNGGRHLEFNISNKQILKAKRVSNAK
jgi:conjugative transposon TraN protein